MNDEEIKSAIDIAIENVQVEEHPVFLSPVFMSNESKKRRSGVCSICGNDIFDSFYIHRPFGQFVCKTCHKKERHL